MQKKDSQSEKYKQMQQNIKKNTKHANQIKNDNPKQK